MGEWKEVSTGSGIDIKKAKGTPYVGTYLGSQQITTKIGPQTVYNFEGEDGKHFGVYGFTNLNRVMANVEIGTALRLTYTGTEKVQTKFGLKDVHQVKVELYTPDKDGDLPF
jgi:hypothetical protein